MPISTRQAIIENYNLEEKSDNDLYNLVSAIAKLFNMPFSTISISLKDSVKLYTAYGDNKSSVSSDNAFSTHIVNSNSPMIVEDLTKHDQFRDNPYVVGAPFMRFFAGIPLTIENITIGAFCMDHKPRQLSEKQLEILQSFGELIAHHIQLVDKYQQMQVEHSLISNSSAVLLSWRYTDKLLLQSVTQNSESVLGIPFDDLIHGNQSFSDFLTPNSLDRFLAMIKGHIQGAESQETQLELSSSKSKSIWTNLLSKGFFTPEGRLQAIQAIASNDTERLHIEHSLNEANKKMRLLLEATDLGTWHLALGTWHLALGTWHLALGTWHLALGTWHLGL